MKKVQKKDELIYLFCILKKYTRFVFFFGNEI